MAVTGQTALGHTKVAIIAIKIPNDDALVSGRRQDHVRYLLGGGDLGNPVLVAPKDANIRQLLCTGHRLSWTTYQREKCR